MHNTVLKYEEVRQLIDSKQLLPTKREENGQEYYTDEWLLADTDELYHIVDAGENQVVLRSVDVAGKPS
jgi:hypothetical protein